jgi:O-antigen/teichoic acid export membrane protein
MSLIRRSVTSVAWNSSANLTRALIFFGRSVLLARWLPVETFGVYALANSVVSLSVIVTGFGMSGAFLHRAPETEDEYQAAAVHFWLKAAFVLAWALVLAVGTLVFATGETRLALLVLTVTTAGVQLAETPQLILVRRVVHRRLALLMILNAVLTTAVALGLASQGVTLWALLATDVATVLLTIVMFYGWRPVWRPRLTWSPAIARYLLSFGGRSFVAGILYQALDQVDDIWTGAFLGKTALGFYSRAYTFATYPRQVLASPINTVSSGTYAELKNDKLRLSQAFFRTNSFLVRTGFLFAGVLALVAPEFIQLLIGEKWLPMLTTFRLMLVFTLLDPLKITISHVFVAVGHPEKMVRARFVQLVILVIGLFILGPLLGINGVAIAVDVMLLAGIAYMFHQARVHVLFSVKRMFAVPALGLIVGLGAAYAVIGFLLPAVSPWISASVKIGVFSILYTSIILLLERDQIQMLVRILKQLVSAKQSAAI